MEYLNIGCGKNIHEYWTNIDFLPSHPSVISCDLRKGIPCQDNAFDACYSSHLIEHLPRQEAAFICNESWRVLKSGGIFRVVVPDLESLTKAYIDALSNLDVEDPILEANYDWIMLELYDQSVRTFTGGEMGAFLSQPKLLNKEFILSRIGLEAQHYWDAIENKPQNVWARLRGKSPQAILNKAKTKIAEVFVFLVAGKKYRDLFVESIFRSSGENHLWMYDRFSLKRLLQNSGFVDIEICDADSSRISSFSAYSLDKKKNDVLHPNSLFMEGRKP